MKKVHLSLISLLAISAFADPVVSNIRASQRENTKLVDIVYDVSFSGGSTVSVTCEVSTNSGTSYTNVLAKSFSGNGYGAIVTIGTDRLITWDAGVDWNEKYSEQMKVRITAKAPRFTVNQNAYYDNNSNLVYSAGDTVTDNQTGLIWATRPQNLITNWTAATAACAAIGDGWRLPTINEFTNLLDKTRTPALPAGHPFKGIRVEQYWASDVLFVGTIGNPVPQASCISVITGGLPYSVLQTYNAVAWPVRSIY
jgi:Tfp pilus assembly protein FimT